MDPLSSGERGLISYADIDYRSEDVSATGVGEVVARYQKKRAGKRGKRKTGASRNKNQVRVGEARIGVASSAAVAKEDVQKVHQQEISHATPPVGSETGKPQRQNPNKRKPDEHDHEADRRRTRNGSNPSDSINRASYPVHHSVQKTQFTRREYGPNGGGYQPLARSELPPRVINKPLTQSRARRMEDTECRYLKSYGWCNRRSTCKFNHNVCSDRPPPMCRYFLLGSCEKGAACQFSHDTTMVPCRFAWIGYGCKKDDCPFFHKDNASRDGPPISHSVEYGIIPSFLNDLNDVRLRDLLMMARNDREWCEKHSRTAIKQELFEWVDKWVADQKRIDANNKRDGMDDHTDAHGGLILGMAGQQLSNLQSSPPLQEYPREGMNIPQNSYSNSLGHFEAAPHSLNPPPPISFNPFGGSQPPFPLLFHPNQPHPLQPLPEPTYNAQEPYGSSGTQILGNMCSQERPMTEQQPRPQQFHNSQLRNLGALLSFHGISPQPSLPLPSFLPLPHPPSTLPANSFLPGLSMQQLLDAVKGNGTTHSPI